MGPRKVARKPNAKSLRERQVEALEQQAKALTSIAQVLEVIEGEFIEKTELPITFCTSTGDGKIFPVDVYVHQKRPSPSGKPALNVEY